MPGGGFRRPGRPEWTEAGRGMRRIAMFMSDAGRHMGLVGAQTPLEIARAAWGMTYVDYVIREIRIREYQHHAVVAE